MNSQQLLEQLKSRKSHGGKKVSLWGSMVSVLPSISIMSKETRLAYLS